MKKYALEYRGYKFDYFFNLGDEIQTLAAVRLLGEVDGYLSRDALHLADVDGLLSMNGFFMGSDNWPPSERIKPILYSFHLDRKHERVVCSDKGVSYLKKHEPIGCRDEGTVRALSKYGIKAYYSGCLTLTFPKRSKESAENAKETFIVGVDKYLEKYIPSSIRKNAIRLNQSSVRLPKIEPDLKRKLAQQLLDGYAKNAKLVITSKIHCAMPCLAMGIPVVFLYPKEKKNDYRIHLIQDFIPINYVSNSSAIYRLGLQKLFSDKVDWNPSSISFEERKKEIAQGFYEALERAKNKL